MNNFTPRKILVIRLSSFGDIVQCMSILKPLKKSFPNATIDWIVRSDNVALLKLSDDVDNIISFDRKAGIIGLIKLAFKLRQNNYDMIYDAHCNIRSKIISWILDPFFGTPVFIRRYKDRLKRILLFKFHKNLFPWPFRGMESFLSPLKKVGVEPIDDFYIAGNFPDDVLKDQKSLVLEFVNRPQKTVVLAPSAAWELKRWGTKNFNDLILRMPEVNFIILGGPADKFCEDIASVDPNRTLNLAGKLSLLGSAAVIKMVDGFVSGDTGMLHVGDILGVPGIALIGPSAFGFPTSKKIKVLEIDLPCRPCTKDGSGKCICSEFKKCMNDITVSMVEENLRKILF